MKNKIVASAVLLLISAVLITQSTFAIIKAPRESVAPAQSMPSGAGFGIDQNLRSLDMRRRQILDEKNKIQADPRLNRQEKAMRLQKLDAELQQLDNQTMRNSPIRKF